MTARLGHRQRGQIVVVVPVALIAMLGMVWLVINAGFYFMARMELQKMADAAALAAVMEWTPVPRNPPNPTPQGAALQYAELNSGLAKGLCTQSAPVVIVDPIQIIQLRQSTGPTGEAPSEHVRVSCGFVPNWLPILGPDAEVSITIQADATAVQGCRDQSGAVFAYAVPCPGATPPPPPPTPDPRLGTRLVG